MIARFMVLAGLAALIAALVQWRVVDREPPSAAGDASRPGYFLTGVDLEEFGTTAGQAAIVRGNQQHGGQQRKRDGHQAAYHQGLQHWPRQQGRR